MKEIARFVIPIPAHEQVFSLHWQGNSLQDIAGRRIYELDGTNRELRYYWGGRFNQSATSYNGRYTVLCERLGTKGLILKDFNLLREINRSYYHSHTYEYPATIFDLPDGRTVLAHCPEKYCRLEIEDIETGERLTARDNKPMDFFFSRLQASLDGKHLLSAGWAWHPIDYVVLFETESALKDPAILDSPSSLSLIPDIWEINSAAFLTPSQLLISGHDGDERQWSISIHDIAENHSQFIAFLDKPAGTMMPTGDHFVSFFGHPKLIETKSGQIVYRWPELPSGYQNSSIVSQSAKIPPIALDPRNLRFAIADENKITVIQLGD